MPEGRRLFWPVDEALEVFRAAGIDVGRSQFYRLIADGTIPSVRAGRIYVLDPERWASDLAAKAITREASPVSTPVTPVPVFSGQGLPRVSHPRFGG